MAYAENLGENPQFPRIMIFPIEMAMTGGTIDIPGFETNLCVCIYIYTYICRLLNIMICNR